MYNKNAKWISNYTYINQHDNGNCIFTFYALKYEPLPVSDTILTYYFCA